MKNVVRGQASVTSKNLLTGMPFAQRLQNCALFFIHFAQTRIGPSPWVPSLMNDEAFPMPTPHPWTGWSFPVLKVRSCEQDDEVGHSALNRPSASF